MVKSIKREFVGEKLADLGWLPSDPNQWRTEWSIRQFSSGAPVVQVNRETNGGDLPLSLPCTLETAQQLEAIAVKLRQFLAANPTAGQKPQD